ncbi:hypothetical protein PODO_19645 [Paenibacillus odorifer]|nr:hypothetical protein PODO_19645 [Paenibacillus odorifer]
MNDKKMSFLEWVRERNSLVFIRFKPPLQYFHVYLQQYYFTLPSAIFPSIKSFLISCKALTPSFVSAT